MAGPIPESMTMALAESILLQIVAANQSVASLRRRGFEYHQILEMMESLVQKQLLTRQPDGVRLTDGGRKRVLEDRRRKVGSGPSEWILPYPNVEKASSGLNDVYVPSALWRPD
jgi:hypothetical protein